MSIGVAILSTDRSHCLKRLLDSIQEYTETQDLNVFVLDDSSKPTVCEYICNAYPWVNFIHTGNRIGIANNTNHAMTHLMDYDYKIIMNNDVEVLKNGWMDLYPNAMKKTGIHHFNFKQIGLWGAGTSKRPSIVQSINGVDVDTIQTDPQGAIIIYDQLAFDTVGYFDSNVFQSYGKSHWMWTFSIHESRIQIDGIHDLVGSNQYFKVHDEKCTTPSKERFASYKRNSDTFKEEFHKLQQGKRPIYTPWEKQ